MRVTGAGGREASLATATNVASVAREAEDPGGPPAVTHVEGPSPFERLLRGLGTEIDRGERAVRSATRGGGADLAPSELLALQAGVYRYSEAVDLAAKLVDRGTSGVKTVLQGQ